VPTQIFCASGASWQKPVLNVADFNGSRANNIVWPLENNRSVGTGGAFEDTKPGTPPAERWKMLASCSHGDWPGNPKCKGAAARSLFLLHYYM
jgi:hypothetical protein